MNIFVFWLAVMNHLFLWIAGVRSHFHHSLPSKLLIFLQYWKINRSRMNLFGKSLIKKYESFKIAALPFDFLLLRVHNIATATRRINAPLIDATMSVTMFFCFFSKLHWPDSHRYGFWPTLAWKVITEENIYVLSHR